MERKEFKVMINASPQKVWEILWNDDTYRQWTAAFAEGSHAVTDWKKGSKVLFLDGRGHGMVSVIAENKPNEYMSIKHLGDVTGGVEDTESEKVKEWAGSTENYTLKAVGVATELTVDIGIPPEFIDYFTDTFPKALARLKEIAES